MPPTSADKLDKERLWKVCSLGARLGRCLSLTFSSHVLIQSYTVLDMRVVLNATTCFSGSNVEKIIYD